MSAETLFRASYSYHGTTVKIHAANCRNAIDQPRGRPSRSAWDLKGATLAEAIADADRSERLTERAWKIKVCPCARASSTPEQEG